MHTRAHKKSTAIFALIAMSMAFFAQISPIWLKNAQGSPIVICTAFGYQTIIIDGNGNELPASPSKIKNNCSLCINNSAQAIITNVKSASYTPPYQNIPKLKWCDNAYAISSNIYTGAKAIRAPPEFS